MLFPHTVPERSRRAVETLSKGGILEKPQQKKQLFWELLFFLETYNLWCKLFVSFVTRVEFINTTSGVNKSRFAGVERVRTA